MARKSEEAIALLNELKEFEDWLGMSGFVKPMDLTLPRGRSQGLRVCKPMDLTHPRGGSQGLRV